jgi:DNA excision repair protein ERCC-2
VIGVIVVGPALPAITPERQAMLHHFEKTTPGQGYNRTYIYPAMARSIQAAGRLMRRADDRGLLILLDDRFLDSAYQKSFPKDWNKDHYQVSQSILNDIRHFWAQHD